MPFGRKKKPKTDINLFKAPDGPGQITRPNPGEYSAEGSEVGQPLNSLGAVPPRGNRAGGGDFIDTGARVGYMRNLEFSAGGRSQIVATGTTSTNRPHISSKTGQVQVSSTTEGNESAGKLGQTPATAGAEPTRGGQGGAQPEMTLTANENLDTSAGAGPERKVDRRGL
ncbi:MAG TPA: hypothetical protein VM536_23130 [Chloroflexia bacterium]|nr:hypothetical protein [Chloroflexia bacterium]